MSSMREHQIVITLKTDQFEEAQRLARQAGASSASTYLRDRIVALLEGGDETRDSAESTRKIQRLARLARDLTRMHRDLQVYVAESWHDTENEVPEAQTEIPVVLREDEPAESKSAAPDAFAGMEIFTSQPEIARSLAAPLADFEKAASIARHYQETGTVNMDQVLEAVSEANDELEELADRAFAISPRLGAIEDPDAGPVFDEDDPLNELLEDTLLKKMSGGRKQPARQAKRQKPHQPVEPKELAPAPEEPEPEPAPEPEPEPAPEAEPEAEPEPESKQDPEDIEDDEDDDKDESSSSSGIHDLSSGPPPKRRKRHSEH
ncbi:MAG: hypothetical protein KC777_26385 [Cyanobacteria bacterium HKST-UBA02]|nr:hypothetical protein [Cyanobacteria bacterium HKST-UBA02]